MLLVVNKALTSFDFKRWRNSSGRLRRPVAGSCPDEDMIRLASGDVFTLRFPDILTKEILHILDQVLQN